MTSPQALMEIREDDIRAHYDAAYQLLAGFEHAPRVARARAEPLPAPGQSRSGLPGRRAFRSTTPGLSTQRQVRANQVRLIERIEAADAEDPLASALQATLLQTLRRALATATAVADLYAEQTGLDGLKRQNLEGRLPADRQTEFGELLGGASLIALHSFANMTGYLLSDHRGEGEIEIGGVEEILTDNPGLALKAALWEFDQMLALHAKAESDLVPTVLAFTEQLMEQAGLRAQAAPRLEPFKAVSYRVEADDFQIDGFSPSVHARSTALVMTFKKPNEVVGNHIAKYQSLKLAKMLMAYDFERSMNPFAEFGGFIFTFMGDGKPGTGKTTLIQMIAGLLHDFCGIAGYPFRYENLSSESIDSYQGKSAQNAKSFIRSVMDPHVIGFGTIDDIDQIAGKRGDRQSSAGQLENHRSADGELRRRQHRGARKLHLRHVLQLPGERRRCSAPAGRCPLPGRRPTLARGLHRHPAPAARQQPRDPARRPRALCRPGDQDRRGCLLRTA